MGQYMVEVYVDDPGETRLAELAERAAAAAESMTRAGIEIAYVRSMLIPQDETCFHVFEAASEHAVRAMSERTGLTSGPAAGLVKQSLERDLSDRRTPAQ